MTTKPTKLKLLSRPQGESIDELAEATGWMKHTAHGTMGHTLKNRLGLTITSEKGENGVRRFRVALPHRELSRPRAVSLLGRINVKFPHRTA